MKTWRKIMNAVYIRIIKPVFFLIRPDQMHIGMMVVVGVVQKLPPLLSLTRLLMGPKNAKPVKGLGGLELATGVGLSAGFDKNAQTVPMMSALGCGFVTVGSITLNPREGNPRPWFYRLPKTKSIVVNAGMANVGVDQVINNLKKTNAHEYSAQVIASVAVVASDSEQGVVQIIEEVIECADKLVASRLVQAIELNISCPNVMNDKLFSVVGNLQLLLDAVDKRNYSVPLLVKMPLLHDSIHFDALVGIVSRSKVSGLTIANLEKDREVAKSLIKDVLPTSVKGGLSGSVTKQHNLETIKRVRTNYGNRFFIIGVGGIFKAYDANEYIQAGADAVGMVTGIIFEGPQIIGEIADAIN